MRDANSGVLQVAAPRAQPSASVFINTCVGGAPDGLNALPAITTAAVANDPSLIQAMQPTAAPRPSNCPRRARSISSRSPGARLAARSLPGSSAVTQLGPNTDPQTIAATAVDSHYVFPPPQTSDMCIDGAKEWAGQLARIALEHTKRDFRTLVLEAHYNSCFGPELKESFSYQARQGEIPLPCTTSIGGRSRADGSARGRPSADRRPDRTAGKRNDAGRSRAHADVRVPVNSLGQALEQQTPDSGVKRFWYNARGSCACTERAAAGGRALRVRPLPDRRGRVVETGLVANSPDTNGAITPLDPTLLKRYADTPDFPNGFTREQTVATYVQLTGRRPSVNRSRRATCVAGLPRSSRRRRLAPPRSATATTRTATSRRSLRRSGTRHENSVRRGCRRKRVTRLRACLLNALKKPG